MVIRALVLSALPLVEPKKYIMTMPRADESAPRSMNTEPVLSCIGVGENDNFMRYTVMIR
jgi:hypothetical protein